MAAFSGIGITRPLPSNDTIFAKMFKSILDEALRRRVAFAGIGLFSKPFPGLG
jgi:hypothetical protein